MEQHFGHIVEKVIRRNGYSISELARLTNVNRRSVYNWFKQKRLKPEIIYRIGWALDYDFSNDFPKVFSVDDFKTKQNNLTVLDHDNDISTIEQINENHWKDKYINLLEKYNDLLKSNVNSLNQEYSKKNNTND